jgi:tetratricopeptide (TPR) repeat protein
LAQIEESEDKKRHLLEEAVQGMEKCLQICTKDLMEGHAAPLPRNFAVLGWFHDWFGQVLHQLYSLTKDEKLISRSIQVYEDAAKTYQKAGMPSRVAEAYWKAAKLYDVRGEYSRAAGSFEQASRDYGLVSEKIPQLKDFCHDHAVYMQAWSEIEKARYHHARQEYGLAKEHFEKAGVLHKSLRQWSYLASNYSAWAELEQAEELSRKEETEEAVKAFEKAARLFAESERSLQTQRAKIENADEKQMANDMVKATALRCEYCSARIAVEEAKILDKKGDHFSSSEKYSSAVEIFEKISQALDSERERREFRLIISLSRAWEKMTLAEAKSSPTLYLEASQLFEQAEDLSPNEKMKMLILAHSRFCRALEAGTRFVDTRNIDMYTDAIKYLESAGTYYVKAGFPKASEYSEATKLLFDAYVHMDTATRESDPERKAKLYAMAEKVLQTSAGSFLRAEHPEKREQVLGLLEKVKKEHELALSLTEVLHAPAIVSATASFNMPAPTLEEAVGSERFEHADIQANLIVRQKELRVGESVEIEMELVNAGKRPALLIKVNEAIPAGFELVEKSENCRVEDSYIDMKGRRLDPLKAEEVRLTVKPKVQGTFLLKPTILYLDENGKYKSHEPESIILTVKELGIKGWLKGER